MKTNRLENFSNFYLDSSEEDIRFMISELEEAGINLEQSEKNIKHLIKEKKAELKIERGKKLKERVEDIIKTKVDLVRTDVTDERWALAARKLEDLTEDDMITIKKDRALLDEIERIIHTESDETRRTSS